LLEAFDVAVEVDEVGGAGVAQVDVALVAGRGLLSAPVLRGIYVACAIFLVAAVRTVRGAAQA